MSSQYFAQVKRNYDRLSVFYDLLSGRAESSIFQRALDLLRSRKTKSVLDVGCGTGKGLIELRDNDLGGTLLVGVDLSFYMCQKTAQLNLKVINSNALNLPFRSSIFDALIFSFSIEIIPDELIKEVIEESFRVIEPGGIVCFIFMADKPCKNLVSALYAWAHKCCPRVVDCRPISIVNYLNEKRFMIIHREILAIYGLPVEIVLAEKG
jgi:demethylmenaquinone methyltransferase/2-methoxy-6-polyprenyl-1,4-benzoquinol methylase